LDANVLSTQITAAAAGAYALRLIQKWDKLPWVTSHTKLISAAFRTVLAFVASVGISLSWNGADHTLIISNLSLAILGKGLWHVFSLYAFQHGWGQLFNVGTLAKVETPVELVNVKGDSVAPVVVGK
jgi:hypothetical protein